MENAKNKRKPLTKKIRFEVFKRDNFTCQYCGRKSPDVVLEVDHITPVSKGGTNDLINLVTSCFDCNRGKGKRKLSDTSELSKQRKQLELLNKRREQMEMFVKWREELTNLEDEQVAAIEKYFKSNTGYSFKDYGRKKCRKWIREFGFSLTYESLIISIDKYFDDDYESAVFAFDKIGGICYNKRRNEIDGYL